jgi:hypothetical protein
VDRIGLLSVNEVVEGLDHLHGERVRVFGALRLEFEGDSMWHLPKSERVDCVPYRSSLWVELDRARRDLGQEGLRQLNGRHVIATGVIDAHHLGHLDLWPAAILVSSLVKA